MCHQRHSILTSLWDSESLQMQDMNGSISCLWCSGWHPHKCSTAPWLQDDLAGFLWLSIVSKTKAYLHSNYKAQSDHFLVQTILCLCSDVCTVWEEVTATKLLDGCTYLKAGDSGRQLKICLCSDTCCVEQVTSIKYTYSVLASRRLKICLCSNTYCVGISESIKLCVQCNLQAGIIP